MGNVIILEETTKNPITLIGKELEFVGAQILQMTRRIIIVEWIVLHLIMVGLLNM